VELQNIGMSHDTVNHTYHFADPVTGVSINSIEATWSKMKPNCPIRQRSEVQIQDNLLKYIWLKRYSNDRFRRFLDILRRFRYRDEEEEEEKKEEEEEDINESDSDSQDEEHL
jgi:bifunctional DNA-binding transcriptional regulator/antitoxin component of YhaV-PrlF toxin-antitoxin module